MEWNNGVRIGWDGQDEAGGEVVGNLFLLLRSYGIHKPNARRVGYRVKDAAHTHLCQGLTLDAIVVICTWFAEHA